MIWVLLQSESPWQRNDALRFLFFFVFLCTMNFLRNRFRWPAPIYMRVGYVFDSRFSERKI